MDNTEYTIKKDEIRSLIAQKEYVQAAEIADTIDWRRVRSVMMLCTISDLYKINRRYEDAKNMLLLAYEYRPGGRSICYSLCELCIKMEEFVEAVAYYKEFVQAAPKDPDRYVLQYKLYEAQDVSLEERIEVLKELKQKEYREKWAYELAYLYHRIGQATLCVEECDELILWFGDGKYVYKAMELKMLHQPLSHSQQEKYGRRPDGIRVQENVSKASQNVVYPQPREQSQRYEQPKANGRAQESVKDYDQRQGYGRRQGYEQEPVQGYGRRQEYEQEPVQGYGRRQEYEQEPVQGYGRRQEYEQEPVQGYGRRQEYEQEPVQGYGRRQEYEQEHVQDYEQTQFYDYQDYGQVREETIPQISPEPEVAERFARMQPSHGEQDYEETQDLISAEAEQGNSDKTIEAEIQVPIMDMGQYNTMNLQAELAAGLQEVLEKESRTLNDEITNSIIAPMLESDTGRLDELDVEELDEDELEVDTGEVEETEVFFGETGEINSVRLEPVKEIVPEMGRAKASEIVPEVSSMRASDVSPVRASDVNSVRTSDEGSVRASDVSSVRTSDVGGDTKVFEIVRTKHKTEERTNAGSVVEADGKLEADEDASGREGAFDLGQSKIVPDVKQVADATAALVMNQMRMENKAEDQVMNAQPPKELANVLSQESDGQISLVMPERETVEKQITGQMSIEDILAEWERIKQESIERRKAELQQRVLQQTGNMFTEFEAAVRDGLLEKLENEIDRELNEASAQSEPEDSVELQGVEEPEDLGEIEELEEIQELDEAFGSGAATGLQTAMESEAETVIESQQPAEAEIAEELTEAETKSSVAAVSEPEKPVQEEAEQRQPVAVSEPEKPVQEEAEQRQPSAAVSEPERPVQEEAEQRQPSVATVSEQEKQTDIKSEAEPRKPVTESIEEPKTVSEPEGMSEPENIEKPAAVLVSKQPVEAEKYASYNTEEPADYLAEEDTEEQEGDSQSFEGQERPPVRKLTREERELYAPYIQSRSAREQLVKAIDNISMAASTGNIVITGEEGMNTITLAKNMIREVQAADRNFAGKVAKISGQGLNQRNVKETLEQLKNGSLIIEKASGMQAKTAAELTQFLQQDHVGIIIVLEDTRKAIARLFAENPRLKTSFTAWMDVEALSNDTLASFGMKYARQLEYSIDDLGMLALHKRIEELQTIDHVVTVVEVKEIVDNAIRHASKKSLGHFMDILLAKRYDEEDMIILTEKDFGVKGGNSE